jgi:hypothetical protein
MNEAVNAPILLPDGRKLRTLRDAITWLAKEIPKSEHKMEKVQNAAYCVTRAAEHGGPMDGLIRLRIDGESYCQPVAGSAVNFVAFVSGDDLEPFWQPEFRCRCFFIRETGNTDQGAFGTPHRFCPLVKYTHRRTSVV